MCLLCSAAKATSLTFLISAASLPVPSVMLLADATSRSVSSKVTPFVRRKAIKSVLKMRA